MLSFRALVKHSKEREMKARFVYMLLVLVTIALGLGSRKLAFLSAVIGDVLYAVMIYWCVRLLFLKKSFLFTFSGSVMFCFVIEGLQAIQVAWLVALRQHSFWKLVLGQGFLWSDLVAYVIGAFLA